MAKRWERELRELAGNGYWRSDEGRRALRAVERSGLEDGEVALRYGIGVERLRRWRKRLRESSATGGGGAAERCEPRFMAVRITGSEPGWGDQFAGSVPEMGGSGVEIVVGGRLVRPSPGFDVATLQRVVLALEGLPC